MKHLGDYDLSAVIYGKFSTYRPSTGAAFTLAGTPALSVYKDNSTTQSTTGVTLTADFDSVTGLNHFAIDTSADGTFYSAGSNFDIVITTGTVDSVSVVGSVVASFSIRKEAALKPTTAGRTLDVTTTGEAGIDLANIGAPAAGSVPTLGIVDNGTAQAATSTTLQLRAAAAFANTELVGAVIVITGGSAGVGQARQITAYNGATDTATVDAWTTTPTGTITYAIFASPPASATPPAVNVTQFNGAAVTSSSGRPEVNLTHVNGVAATSTGGRPEVNTTHVGGTSQTAGDIIGDTNDIQARLPAALVSGRIDASVGAMAANVITAAAAASDFGTEVGTAVWATTTRELTAGTNIVLAKGTGVTGLNDLDAAGVRGAVGLATANLDTQLSAINSKTTNLPTDPADESLIIAATDAIMTRLGTPAGASVSADIAAVKSDSAAILVDTAEIGAAGAGLTALASAANLATVAGYVDTEVAAIKATTDKLDATLVNSSDGYIFTAAALQDAPTGGGGLTAAAIADAVWEEAIADHSGTAGSTAEALNAAGAAGDPWITALPGGYSAGQAGFILGTNLNTTISSRASQTTVDDLPTNAELATALGSSDDAVLAVLGTPAGASLAADVAAVQSDTNDIQSRLPASLVSGRIDASVGAMASNVMTAAAAASDLTTELQSGLATSTAVASLDAKIDVVDANVDAILVDTAEIGVAGAGLTALASAANLAVVAGYLDTEIAAIKAKTDNLPAAPAAVGDIPTAAAIADAVHDEAVDGTVTFRQSVRLANAVLGGKASGLETTAAVYRDLADTKDRITATVDVDGNRTAVTRDLT